MDAGVVVSQHPESHRGTKSDVFQYGHVPLRELEDTDPEAYQAMVKLFCELGDNLIGNIIEKDWSESGFYLQNIIVTGDDRERDVLYEYLLKQGETFKRDLFGFSFDDDHVHIIHSCAFAGSTCKCKWRTNLPKVGKPKPGYAYRSKFRDWTEKNWIYAILYFYFCKGGRREAWITGRKQGLNNNLKRIQWEAVQERVRSILQLSNDKTGNNLQPGESDREFSTPIIQRGKRSSGYTTVPIDPNTGKKLKISKWEIVYNKMEKLLSTTAICPLEGIRQEKLFLKDFTLTDPRSAADVTKAIEIWSTNLNNWTLKEYQKMYEQSDPSTLIFSRSKKYMTMEESINILDKLLKFQFQDSYDQIASFLQNLVNILDWQPEGNPDCNTKTNTILVHSEPSAGKNFFFDAILTLLLNFGQLGTANKSNSFAFQDAANRRVILWNEPNYEKSMTDYLKTLFEGGDTKVRVKMTYDTHVRRTPIIILTNQMVNFMVDTAFNDRIKQYSWKPAPFLKQYALKPYPLSFFDLLIKYNVLFK